MKKIIELIKKNYVISAGVLLLICLFIGVTIFIINKGTNALEENVTNSILLSCPEKVAIDGEINCNVVANIVDKTVMSVNVNYNLPEGVTVSKFTLNTDCDEGYCFEEYANTENGFALVNLNGINKSASLGVLTLKFGTPVVSNKTYDIGFTNVEYVSDEKDENGDYLNITLDDAKTQVRTLSDINTLDSVEINGTFDKEFSSDVLEYKVTVEKDVDKIKINAKASDENSTIAGDTEETSLHYGTNSLKIIVTSEDGKEKTYTFNVYRKYEFNTDSYIYNKDKNVLFTGNVYDNDKIIAGLKLEDNLNKKINNGKLEVMYGEEVISTVDLANFKYTNTVSDKVLYVDKDTTYDTLIGNLTLNKVSIKIIDSNKQEVSSGVIDTNMKMEVYLDDALLDTYAFTTNYLNFDDSLNVNEEKKFFENQTAGTKISELKSKISTSGEINYISNDGNAVEDNDIIKTGDKVSININGKESEYSISVLGDVTGDGEIKINDVSKIYRFFKGRITSDTFGDIYVSAGDVTKDGDIKINDVSKIYRFFKGRITSL